MSKLDALRTSGDCPSDCKEFLAKASAESPKSFHGKISEVIQGAVAADIPWLQIAQWVASNWAKLIELFQNGISVQSIIDLIVSLLKPVPEPGLE